MHARKKLFEEFKCLFMSFGCTVLLLVNPPKTECDCLHGGVIENGRACNPLTLCSVPALFFVQVWVHTPGVTQSQSVQLRNATTTTFS